MKKSMTVFSLLVAASVGMTAPVAAHASTLPSNEKVQAHVVAPMGVQKYVTTTEGPYTYRSDIPAEIFYDEGGYVGWLQLQTVVTNQRADGSVFYTATYGGTVELM